MDAAKEKLKQAASLFEEVATALTVPNPDLVICARKCLRATDLLEWHDQSMWLNLELEGYPTGAELPNYRIIPASLVYQSPKYLAEILAEQPDELRPQKINIPLPYPISDLIRARKSGYKTQTGNQKESYISYLKKGIVAEEFLKIDPIEIERALDHITNRLFEIARRGAILLLYGETITSVFEKYQSLVNDKLAQLQIQDYLQSAYRNLTHKDQASWQSTIMDCRNCIIQLASILWQAPDQTHPVLKDEKRQPMSLAPDKEKNRLKAYIHEKISSKSRKRFLKKQAERLTGLLYDFYELLSKGKKTATFEEAASALINTYVFLGDLAIFTDLEPVTKIETPE